MKNKKVQKNKAFTLIETIVAIFVLLLAVTGPMSAAQNSLKASFLARDQIGAFYLAQDAIEYIKNFKDKQAVDGNPLSSTTIFTSTRAGESANWRTFNIDSTIPDAVFLCGTVNPSQSFDDQQCGYLKINTDGYYSISSGDDSKYRRTIALRGVREGEYAIVVRIEWDTNLFLTERSITVQENIFDWLPTS